MNIIKKMVDLCCGIAAKLGMVTIFILLALTVGDVLGRYIFNSPIPGTFELTKILFALSTFFSFSVSQKEGENLGITILYDRFPARIRGLLDFLSSLIGMAMFSVAFVQMIRYAERMRSANTITSVLRWPMYPWIYLASVGILVLVIALVWDFIVSIMQLKGGNEK